ncbi:MAG: methyltransferase domain-containing protein [Kofleriaceae bacterium]
MGILVTRIREHDEELELYRELYGADAVDKRAFHNVGAGLFRHAAWTNIDHRSEWYSDNQVDISCDLLQCQVWPIAESSSEVVYSSHTIEHITDAAAQALFNEAYRILKIGGCIRLTTPDIELYCRAMLGDDRHFWAPDIAMYSKPENLAPVGIGIPMNRVSTKQLFLFAFASQTSSLHADASTQKITDQEVEEIFRNRTLESALDYCVSKCSVELHKKYPGNHINWWTETKLVRMLQEAGFRDIRRSAYAQSSCPVLRNTAFFDNTWPSISLYVEARK